MCSKEDITIKTFQVTPLNKRLGLLEWVPNTEPVKAMLNRELKRHYATNDLNETEALNLRMNWISSVASSAGSVSMQHVMLLAEKRAKVADSFLTHTRMLPWDLAR
jgi:phosphatidylinositol kinase/protein kinase (PI-3  family)